MEKVGGWCYGHIMHLELAPICVAQSFPQHFAPFELHTNIKTLMNTPPYQKYTFSERKLHVESKYDTQKCVGGRVRMSGLGKSAFLDQILNFPSCVISPYPQPCVGGRVRMSGLGKSTFLDQILNFPSCVISPYPQPLHGVLPIYHRIWIPHEIPLQKMYTWAGVELTIE